MNEISESAYRKDKLTLQIKKYRDRLHAFILKKVGNPEDAEDILQDVFYQFAKNMQASFSPIEEVSAWLYRVARNMIINKGKKKKEENWPLRYTEDYGEGEEIEDDISNVLFNEKNSEDTPETEYMRSLVWEEFGKALLELPPEQREVFEMSEMEGFTVKEIAEKEKVPVNTVLSRKHYAVVYLRSRLENLYREMTED